jgi:hypothetical protein
MLSHWRQVFQNLGRILERCRLELLGETGRLALPELFDAFGFEASVVRKLPESPRDMLHGEMAGDCVGR